MHRLCHALGRYEQSNDLHLIYRHRVDCCINCVFVDKLFTIVSLVEVLLTFIGIYKKICFTSTSIGKCHKCLEINLVHFFLAQFHPKKTMSQALCFDIEYWRSYGPFLFNKLKWNKIQSSFIVHNINYSNFLNIFNKIIFRFDGFQPHHLPVISTIYMLILSVKRWVLCCWNPPSLSSLIFSNVFKFFWFKRGSSCVLLDIPIL